jgi:hypothetical protein
MHRQTQNAKEKRLGLWLAAATDHNRLSVFTIRMAPSYS